MIIRIDAIDSRLTRLAEKRVARSNANSLASDFRAFDTFPSLGNSRA